jgi:hypothetical protein
MAVLGQCTKLSVLTVARRQKFLSSQQRADQYIVETAIKSIADTRSPVREA